MELEELGEDILQAVTASLRVVAAGRERGKGRAKFLGLLRACGELAAYRDAVLYLTIFGWGIRRTEAAALNVTDWRANAAHPQFGRLGQLVIRQGKSARGSPPRRRVVLSVFPWAVAGVKLYLDDVRPRFFTRYEDLGALFPTERGGWISPRQIDERFADIRDEAGLDKYLNPHCLRHTYVTTLIERGWPVALVQKQAGHSHAAMTAIYTALSDDFKDKWIYKSLHGVLPPPEPEQEEAATCSPR